MKTKTAVSRLDELLALPYTKTARQDADGWVVRITELPGCIAHGSSVQEAFEHLAVVQRMWLEDAIENNDPIPQPEPDEDSLPSGKWLQRVPKRLHQRLIALAKSDGVSLNQFVATSLATTVGSREKHASVQAAVAKAIQAVMCRYLTHQAVLPHRAAWEGDWSLTQPPDRTRADEHFAGIRSYSELLLGREEREHVYYGFGGYGHLSGFSEKRTAGRGRSSLRVGEF